ncbi:MAG TPA: type II toxin-antitoxin system RelE/ParE family toxin [Silvibacterium sp.]|nr:type II toxin-antitoxin system RelE/ParE family toxin [Silvibacterium sp.]
MNFVIQPMAREDILRQYRYYLVEKNTEETAEKFLSAIQVAIQQVMRHAGIGSPKVLNHPALEGLRSTSVKGFPAIRIYYQSAGSTLRIIRILHGKRDIVSIFANESE